MPRTTLEIDAPILRDLKRLQRQERKSLGRLVSELLARALEERRSRAPETVTFAWISRPMGDLVRERPARGNQVPDAHLAALSRQHGVATLYTSDSDFRRFAFLKVVNPFE